MGSLSYPLGDSVYIDANILIYTVERVQPHVKALRAFWRWTNVQSLVVLTSELTVLELLVGPLKANNQGLEARFRRLLFQSADLRASTPALKTPDAIHAATALEVGARTFITNDLQFRQVPGLSVVTPRDLAAP